MTCIIGLLDSGNVYIGGDSAGVRRPFVVKCLAGKDAV